MLKLHDKKMKRQATKNNSQRVWLRMKKNQNEGKDLQVVDCYQESQVFKKRDNNDHSLEDCYEGVYFSECKIATDYRNALLELYLNEQSRISEAEMNQIKSEYIRELSRIMTDQKEYIESHQDQIFENVNKKMAVALLK